MSDQEQFFMEARGETRAIKPLVGKPISQSSLDYMKQVASPAKPVTLDDMLKDFETFKVYDDIGAFDADSSAWEMIKDGGYHIAVDTGAWLATMPERVAGNFLEEGKEKATMSATQMQLYGNVGVNWEALLTGVKRLGLKYPGKWMGDFHQAIGTIDITDEEFEISDKISSYEFWRDINELEKKRASLVVDAVKDETWLSAGLSPETKQMILSGEATPDMQVAMGGSMWADPINYIPFGAAFKVGGKGSNVAFRGVEAALIKETQDMIATRAILQQQIKSGARATGKGAFGKNVSGQSQLALAALDDMIKQNGQKIGALSSKRDVALNTLARQLPGGHPLKKIIDESLEGITIKGRTTLAAKAAGASGVLVGKTVENVGNTLRFLQTLPVETATNLMIKMGIPEEKAVAFFSSGIAKKTALVGGSYAAINYFTDDELLAVAGSGAMLGLPMLARYGRDLSIAGRELMLAETTLPYFKRLGSHGAETVTERLVDRSVFFPIRSTAEKAFGAAEGKLAQKALSPTGKLSAGTQGAVDFLNTSKTGRWLEQAGRVAAGTGTGASIGGVFGFAASGGGDMEEAFYGGIGAGSVIGFTGGSLGSLGRMRGFRNANEVTQARYGDWNYYKNNLLPAGMKDAFGAMPRQTQMAYASYQMSFPDVLINFKRNGRNADAGGHYTQDGQSIIDVNADSGRAIDPLLSHEITHHLDRVGGVLPFNEMLVGNAILDQPGIFTAKDKDGNYIKVGEAGNPNNPLRYKPNEKFDAHRREYGRKRGLSDEAIERVMTDEITVREIVAEHGTDFFLNDPRRYRDLHEGPIGAMMRGLVDGPFLNNVPFLRNFLAKLGGTFRGDGMLTSPNAIFSKMERIPGVTELIRKYNRQIEGLSPKQREEKFPMPEGKPMVKVTGAELAKNPELVELIRAGTILKIDENGNVVADLAMTPREANKYNKNFTEALKEAIEIKERDEGLPDGHVRETQDAAGRTTISGRFLNNDVIDTLEASGNWNKEQIATLRRINNTLGHGKPGNEFLLHYFKATSKRTGRKYVNASVETLVEVPYGIELSKKGNILIRTVNVDQLVKNVDKLVKQQPAEVSRLYGTDLDAATTAIIRDIDTYHKNHADGRPGETGLDADPQIALAKKNLINSAFGRTRKEQLDMNPWLAQLGKKEPRAVYRSRRIERIGKADQLSGERFVDPDKIAKNFLPPESQQKGEGVPDRQRIDRLTEDRLAMPKKDEGEAFARPLEEILERIPEGERFVGNKAPGQPHVRPNGKPFLEADLDAKIGPLHIKQKNIDKFFQESLDEAGPAARRAFKQMAEGEEGVIMTPPDEAHWGGVEKLTLRDRFWYEISSEAMNISFPDHVGPEKVIIPDMTSATSPLAHPNYNSELMISIMSEAARNEPSTTPAVVQKSVADAFSGEFGKQEARKVGSFAQSFKFFMGLDDTPPLSTNDRQVAASFGIPDEAFGKYPVLYEVVARFYNKLRDHTNAERTKRNQVVEGPLESPHMQAGSWVQKRAENLLANRKKITEEEAFEGDAYANGFKLAADKLRAAGVKIDKDPGTGLPLFTKEVLRDPRVVETLSPLAIKFRQDQFGTMEIVSLLHEEGAKFAELMEKSREVGSKLNLRKGDDLVRKHLKKLLQRKKRGEKKLPSMISELAQLMSGEKDEVTRIELGYGTFEGAMSRNIRIPLGKVPEKHREAFLAILGKEYMQAAQAASTFAVTDSANPSTYSVFIKGLKEDNPAIKTFAESLSDIGHEANISQRPNGLVLDINPKFLEDFSTEAIDRTALNRLLGRTFTKYDPQVTGRAYDSIYIERADYNKAIANFKKDIRNEYIGRIQGATGAKKGLAENYLRGAVPERQALKAPVRKRVERIRTAYDKHISDRQSLVRKLRKAAKQLEKDTAKLNPELRKRIDRQVKANIKRIGKENRYSLEDPNAQGRMSPVPDNRLMMPKEADFGLPPMGLGENRLMPTAPTAPIGVRTPVSKASVSRDLLEKFRD